MEEELPIDVGDELGERRLELAAPREGRLGQVVEPQTLAVRARLREREQRPALLLLVLLAQPLLKLAVLLVERAAAIGSSRRETTSTTRLASST